MTRALLIATRELSVTLRSPSTFSIAAIMLFVDGILFNAFALGAEPKPSHLVLEHFFEIASGTTMIAAILIAMRAFVQEREQGTLVLLFNSPTRSYEMVLGKFFASFALLTLLVLSTAYLPLMVVWRGSVAFAHVGVGYLGLVLLGAAALSLGLLGSVLSRSQLLAGLIGGALLVTLLLGWLLARLTAPPLSDVMLYLAFFETQFRPLGRGILGLSNVVYFCSVTALALAASSQILGGERFQ